MTGTIRGVLNVCAVAALFAMMLTALQSHAQEFDPGSVVSDSTFNAGPVSPVSYQSDYIHDQVRGAWTQTLSYARAFKRTALSLNGSSNTSEDELKNGSRTTTGDLAGRIDFKALSTLILSLDGRYSMSSLADGSPLSTSQQRHNNLAIRSQYDVRLPARMTLMLLGSSEFQRNYDTRFAKAFLPGDTATARPESVIVQRNSSYASARLDGARASLDWKVVPNALIFQGSAFGSRNHPSTTVRSSREATPGNSTPGLSAQSDTTVRIPVDNSSFDGTLTFDQKKGTVAVLKAKRSGFDQVYFDIGQLKVEQLSTDARLYNFTLSSVLRPGFVANAAASLGRNLREYQSRSGLNALTTAREGTLGLAYSSATRMLFVNMTVNRTRAERQATGNGITLTRVATANFQQRLTRDLWLVGLGSANLNSYRYDFVDPDRSFSKDDRDGVSAFGSVGVRFTVTPRCSTMVNFSASRQHSVALDASRSNGNLANNVYQLNGALRMPLSRNLTINQDYILTATYRFFDFDPSSDDLSRLFRIDTTVADTLFPFAFIRMDHRYSFFDRGEFTPFEDDPNGPQFYGVSQEQAQQTVEGTVGIRPLSGVTFTVKQSMTDTENREIAETTKRSGSEQWNLSLGMEVNRTFWEGAGLTASIRREDRYQTRSDKNGALFREGYWLAGITFQKDF